MKYKKGFLVFGLPTVITILILLIFSYVSMLSLTHARSNMMKAQHTMEISKAYYEADSKGQQIIGLLSAYHGYAPDYIGQEMENILNEQGIASIYKKDNQNLSFVLPAGDAGILSVEINLISNGKHEITKWQILPPESEQEN